MPCGNILGGIVSWSCALFKELELKKIFCKKNQKNSQITLDVYNGIKNARSLPQRTMDTDCAL